MCCQAAAPGPLLPLPLRCRGFEVGIIYGPFLLGTRQLKERSKNIWETSSSFREATTGAYATAIVGARSLELTFRMPQ